MTDINTPFWLVIPAAGSGSRMQSDVPKQYQLLSGKTVLEVTLEKFLSIPSLKGVVVAIGEQDDYWKSLAVSGHEKVSTVVGGEERANSVFNALASLESNIDSNEWILVHDAARPLVETGDVVAMLDALSDSEAGGIMAIPVTDTVKVVDQNEQITETRDRASLWKAQTPQMFRFGVLFSALKTGIEHNSVITDESSAVEQLGYKPRIFPGKRSNIKITLPEDMELARGIINSEI